MTVTAPTLFSDRMASINELSLLVSHCLKWRGAVRYGNENAILT